MSKSNKIQTSLYYFSHLLFSCHQYSFQSIDVPQQKPVKRGGQGRFDLSVMALPYISNSIAVDQC